jgi:hypothetical protein
MTELIARQVYETTVKAMPLKERMQLVSLIMDDLKETAPRWGVNEDDTWSEQDLHDLTLASLAYVARQDAND